MSATPYNAEFQLIEATLSSPYVYHIHNLTYLSGAIDGYLRAKAEDAALLEAAKAAYLLLISYHHSLHDYPLPNDRRLPSTISKLRAAIAATEKGVGI